MLTRLKTILPAFIGIFLLLASVWVIHQELQHYSAIEIWRNLTAIPQPQVQRAIALTWLSLLIFTGYDTLAVRYIRHPLPYLKTALAAVTSIPISNSVGFALLSGSAIRYRFYTAWGLSALQITQVIAFCNLSFWLGLFVVGGILFVGQPIALPSILHLPFATTQPIGIGFLLVIVGYLLFNLLWGRSGGRSLRDTREGSLQDTRKQSFQIPRLPIQLCLAQILVSSLDWILAATVFYTLLPVSSPIAFSAFFGVYLLAQFAGVISSVPGGLGVFETVMLLLLSPNVSSPVLLGFLLAYRAIYYLLPLAIAVALLGSYELYQRLR
jgi:glycosyltransferase 2 family protein